MRKYSTMYSKFYTSRVKTVESELRRRFKKKFIKDSDFEADEIRAMIPARTKKFLKMLAICELSWERHFQLGSVKRVFSSLPIRVKTLKSRLVILHNKIKFVLEKSKMLRMRIQVDSLHKCMPKLCSKLSFECFRLRSIKILFLYVLFCMWSRRISLSANFLPTMM